MSNSRDETLTGTETETGTSTSTETGTFADHQETAGNASEKAKNKSNLVFFVVLGVVGVLVLLAGYYAFIKKPAPHHTAAPAPLSAPHHTPKPNLPVKPKTQTKPAQAPAASAPSKSGLTSTEDAANILGPSPSAEPNSPPPAPGAAPSAAVSSAPSTIPMTIPGSPQETPTANPLLDQGPAPTASPVTSAPSAATPPELSTPAPSNSTPSSPNVANPAVQGQINRLAGRVTNLEGRMDSVENRLGKLEHAPHHVPRHRAVRHHVTRHHVRHAKKSTPKNEVSLVPTKKASHELHIKAKAVDKLPPLVPEKAQDACNLASIVPNRFWTKMPDGTFRTYGVGDRAPNGAVITSIDPEKGIMTEKGKLKCHMAN